MYLPEDLLASDLMVKTHHPNRVPISPSYADDLLFQNTVHKDRSPARDKINFIII